jgi:hypothetical protein
VPERLAASDVPDPGHLPLVEQRLADPAAGRAGRAVERVALGQAASVAPQPSGQEPVMPSSRTRAALAGAAAAAVWGLTEPLDRRLLRHDYSDVALLGKWLTRGPLWWPAGFALHAANGAAFGLAFHEARRLSGAEPRRLALGMALAEHAALFPLGAAVDRRHPARGQPGVARMLSAPAFVQATWRHALFGWVLGRLAGR